MGCGYRGAGYLLELKQCYGIDLVTGAQHDGLALAEDLNGLAQTLDAS